VGRKLRENQGAILSEMAGVVSSADDVLPSEEWMVFIKKPLLRLLEVDVPTRLILEVVSPVAPLSLAPRTSQCDAFLEILLVLEASRPCTGCTSKSDDPG
jgi:hypothetical protein